MRVIKNKILPPRGFTAINLFGVIFTRRDSLSERTIRHEAIHTQQMRELLYVFFYVIYIAEWLFKLVQYRNKKEAYHNISFEREAYANDTNNNYLTQRKLLAQWKH